MKLRKLLILIVIFIFTAVTLPLPAGAASVGSNYEKALDLKVLGLLKNPPEQFELERAPERIEGAVMLVRLLGREKQALSGNWTHPFTDVPAWADRYVGYMYQNQLTKGIGNSKFGTHELITANQYITFVLRSLGYDDKTDFDYRKAIDKAVLTGLLGTAEGMALKSSSTFIRNDLVGISYNALNTKLKASTGTLLDKLANTDKAVFKPAAKLLGLYTSDLMPDYGGIATYKPTVTTYGSVVKNSRDLFLLIRKALYLNEGQLKLDIRNYSGNIADDFEPALDKADAIVTEVTGVSDFLSQWKYEYNSQTFTLTLQYRISKTDFTTRKNNARAALNKARLVAARLINNEMSDYDKEKTLHDYIINNTKYDYQNYLNGTIPYESYESYGSLVLGTAVCEGYAKAMKLMSDLSSLECIVASGDSYTNGHWESHAWNIIKIDKEYYHLDTTRDDPVTDDGTNVLAYHFFNLNDTEMAKASSWDKASYPVCTGIKNNYYYKNNLVVENRAAFDNAILEAIKQHKTSIELKVLDYTKSGYSNLSDTVFKLNTVSWYNYVINEELGIIEIYNLKYF